MSWTRPIALAAALLALLPGVGRAQGIFWSPLLFGQENRPAASSASDDGVYEQAERLRERGRAIGPVAANPPPAPLQENPELFDLVKSIWEDMAPVEVAPMPRQETKCMSVGARVGCGLLATCAFPCPSSLRPYLLMGQIVLGLAEACSGDEECQPTPPQSVRACPPACEQPLLPAAAGSSTRAVRAQPYLCQPVEFEIHVDSGVVRRAVAKGRCDQPAQPAACKECPYVCGPQVLECGSGCAAKCLEVYLASKGCACAADTKCACAKAAAKCCCEGKCPCAAKVEKKCGCGKDCACCTCKKTTVRVHDRLEEMRLLMEAVRNMHACPVMSCPVMNGPVCPPGFNVMLPPPPAVTWTLPVPPPPVGCMPGCMPGDVWFPQPPMPPGLCPPVVATSPVTSARPRPVPGAPMMPGTHAPVHSSTPAMPMVPAAFHRPEPTGAIRLQTPLFDAHCDSVSSTGNPDELVLIGNVRVMMKRDLPCSITAHRMVINTRTGTFHGEGSGAMTTPVSAPTTYEMAPTMPYAVPSSTTVPAVPVYRMPR